MLHSKVVPQLLPVSPLESLKALSLVLYCSLFFLIASSMFPSATSSMIGYADDVTYTVKIKDDEDVIVANKYLMKICSWITDHGLKLNLNKIKAMIISRKCKPPKPAVSLLGHQLEFVDTFKLLGVLVTSQLSWVPHIHEIVAKTKRLLGVLYRVFRECGSNYLSLLFKSILYFHISITAAVSGILSKSPTRINWKVCYHLLPGSLNNWSQSSHQLKNSLNWPTLEMRWLYQKICLCRKILKGSSIISPSFFQIHPHPCSSHLNSLPIYRPYIRTLHHKHSFKYAVIDEWNRVPDHIVSLPSESAFKSSKN